MAHLFFQDILIIFTVSIPLVMLLKRINLPLILGFMLTGALIGPHGFGIISEVHPIEELAELGLAFLLFSVGLEFSFEKFRELRGRVFAIAGLQLGITVLIAWLVGAMLGWPLFRNLYFGCVVSLSSTSVVLTVLHQRRMLDSLAGQLSAATLIIQDVAFILMMVLLPLFVSSQLGDPLFSLVVIKKLLTVFLLIMIPFLGRILLAHFLRLILIAGRRDLFTIAVILIGFGSSWLATKLGLSFALGAFIGGVLVGFTEYKYQALSEVAPFRYCFNSLFFVSLGMLLNLSFVSHHVFEIALLLITTFIVKTVIVMWSVKFSGYSLRVGLLTGLYLAQIGEFSFLLVQSGYELGILKPYLRDLIIAAAVFGMMLSPFVMIYAPRLLGYIDRHLAKKPGSNQKEQEKDSGLFPTMSDHVIICGFGPLGETLGTTLQEHDIDYLVLELNPTRLSKMRSQNIPAFFGDGASEDILYRSGIERARALAITIPDFLNTMAIIHQARLINPDIQIITRAKYRNEVDLFYAAGADVVISEELEGGIEMGRYVMKMIGIHPQQVNTYAEKIREFGSADFF
jgi:monovalent cation:H+ antiporter-2, CPA2 family